MALGRSNRRYQYQHDTATNTGSALCVTLLWPCLCHMYLLVSSLNPYIRGSTLVTIFAPVPRSAAPSKASDITHYSETLDMARIISNVGCDRRKSEIGVMRWKKKQAIMTLTNIDTGELLPRITTDSSRGQLITVL